MIEKGRVISLISSAAGLLLAVGSMTVFSACGPKEDGTLMICHNAQIRVAMCGIGLAVLFAIAAFVKSKAIKLICDTAALVLSVVTFMTFCGHIYDAGSTCANLPSEQHALSGQA